MADICHMAKPAKTPSRKPPQRPARDSAYLGRTADGLLIPRPDFKPESFTLQQLDRAIRAAKRRQAAAQAG